ncbi:hypothetical protein [Roseinatronobacter sp.]|uniref:hypothetical protein n=1 Tax=Roseinatronobacter sp. TaxID=1945755 RepID=UPI003F7063F9
MLTSAQSLNQILVQCAQEKDKAKRFALVLAKVLDTDNPSEIFSAQRLFSIASKVEADIAALPHTEDEKKHLQKLYQPFRNILDLSAFSMNMQTAKSHFLKAENLTNLVSIHMGLKGFADINEPKAETIEFSTRLREIRMEISSSDLPLDLRLNVSERLRQIENALEKYYAFGADFIERELNELTGAIVIHLTEVPKDRNILEKTLSAIGVVRRGVRETKGAVTEINEIAEATRPIIELLGKGGG